MINSTKNNTMQRGVVTVYMALTIVVIMVASTVILTDVISRQFRSASDVEFSERAFYAASSGFEHASYIISRTGEPDQEIVRNESISYGAEGNAEYSVTAQFSVTQDNQIIYEETSICSQADFRDASRRLIYGSEDSC